MTNPIRERKVKVLDNFKKHISKLNDITSRMSIHLNSDMEPSVLYKDISIINKTIRRLVNDTYKVYEMIKEVDVYTANNGVPGLIMGLEIEWIGDRLHIICPELLPKRLKHNGEDPYTYENLRQMYLPSIEAFFSDDSNKRLYNERVVIVYTYYYKNNERKKDYDNYETKFMTDILSSNLLYDDSPVFCCVYQDYRQGTKTHTEIDVMPEREFLHWIQKR